MAGFRVPKCLAASLALALPWLSVSVASDEVSPISYATVAEAQRALRADPTSSFSEVDGWVVVERKGPNGLEIWSFPPESHAAYPSAVMRIAVRTEGNEWQLDTRVLCQSLKRHCDSLMEKMRWHDQRIKEQLQKKSELAGD